MRLIIFLLCIGFVANAFGEHRGAKSVYSTRQFESARKAVPRSGGDTPAETGADESSAAGEEAAPFRSEPAERLILRSAAALIVDQDTGRVIYEKNGDAVHPIASITKLMTALVVLESGLSLSGRIMIDQADVDMTRRTRSRLRVGTVLDRNDLLRLALMASENRAAAALARVYPGGVPAFVARMNERAKQLGLTHTHFSDPTGLSDGNVSSPRDLVVLVETVYQSPRIREFSTTPEYVLSFPHLRRPVAFKNTNLLVRHGDWAIGLSKTGFIRVAGHCLVMQARIAGRRMVLVLLDSWGRYSRIGDANRVRRWIESN